MSNKKPYLIGLVIAFGFVIVAIVAMTLMSPAIGNVFTNTAAALGSDGGGGGYAASYAPSDGTTVLADVSGAVLVQEEQAQQRVILKDAILGLTVDDPETRLAEIAALAEEMGGWIVSSNINRYTDSAGEQVARGEILVRVPSERLTEALERIKTGAGAINSENVTGRDVTQEYIDLSSRLKNLEAAEVQLQSIMDSAKKVEDVLAVHAELVSIRGQIESIKGQLQYFDIASAFSSVRVNLSPPSPNPVQAQTSGWSPANTAESALGALVSVVRAVVDLVIAMVVFFGPIVVVIGGIWWVLRRVRNRNTQPGQS
jgi:hypothetical protein